MRILMTGSSGPAGCRLLEHLFSAGHRIYCLQRNRHPSQPDRYWGPRQPAKDEDDGFQAVIHLPEETMTGAGWRASGGQHLPADKDQDIRQLIQIIGAQKVRPRVFIHGSAVSLYGDRPGETVDESSSPGQGVIADLCRQREDATLALVEMGIRVVHLRCGVILQPQHGSLQTILPPFQLMQKSVPGCGKDWISWISNRDLEAIVSFILTHEQIDGPVNVVSPTPVSRKDLAQAMAAGGFQSSIFRALTAAILHLQGRIIHKVPLDNCQATPRVLQESGYLFIDGSLERVKYCGCAAGSQ